MTDNAINSILELIFDTGLEDYLGESVHSAEEINFEEALAESGNKQVVQHTRKAISAGVGCEHSKRKIRDLRKYNYKKKDAPIRRKINDKSMERSFISAAIVSRLHHLIALHMYYREEAISYKIKHNFDDMGSKIRSSEIYIQPFQSKLVELRSLARNKYDLSLGRLDALHAASDLSDREYYAILLPLKSQSLEQTHEELYCLLEHVDQITRNELEAALSFSESLSGKIKTRQSATRVEVGSMDESSNVNAIKSENDMLNLTSVAYEVALLLTN